MERSGCCALRVEALRSAALPLLVASRSVAAGAVKVRAAQGVGLCPTSAGVSLPGVTLPPARHHYSFAEYLEVEESSQVRHEYYSGEIYAMAGGTPEHAAIVASVTAALGRQLSGEPCRVYSSDLRVRILATGLATYPDVTVICGPSVRDPESPTHVVNPKVVVEVLSPSTATPHQPAAPDQPAGSDRTATWGTEKLQHYQQVPSLDAIVLVEPRGDQVTLWRREGTLFEAQTFGPGEIVPIDVIGCTLAVDELAAAALGA